MKTSIFAAIGICATLTVPAWAQDTSKYGLEAGISTLGLFVAPDVRVNEQLRVRTPLYFGGTSDVFDLDGNDVDGSVSVESLTVLADYYVGRAGLRVSGGLSFGGYRLNGDLTNPTLDGRTYNGNFNANIEQDRDIAPVIALGYQRSFGDSWGLMAEIGARVTSMTLSTTGQENLSVADRTDFNAEISDANDDLNELGIIPYISLGATFRF